jgi:hypothetical protein
MHILRMSSQIYKLVTSLCCSVRSFSCFSIMRLKNQQITSKIKPVTHRLASKIIFSFLSLNPLSLSSLLLSHFPCVP